MRSALLFKNFTGTGSSGEEEQNVMIPYQIRDELFNRQLFSD